LGSGIQKSQKCEERTRRISTDTQLIGFEAMGRFSIKKINTLSLNN